MIYLILIFAVLGVGLSILWTKHSRLEKDFRTTKEGFDAAKEDFSNRIYEIELAWGKVKVEGKVVCTHCQKLVDQYFFDGYGRSACANCKPEAFAYALREGKVQK